jgi:hypothetical protein
MTHRAGRFFLGLVFGLACVTWIGSVVHRDRMIATGPRP